jgi:ATP-dependent Zn protease
MNPQSPRELIAFHEAAHAVVARKLGLVCFKIAMFPIDDRGTAGTQTSSEAHAADLTSEAKIAGLAKDAKVALAGPIANMIHTGQPRSLLKGTDRDVEVAHHAIANIALLKAGPSPTVRARSASLHVDAEMLKQANALLKQFASETETLVRENWASIERVAAVLVTKDLVDAAELDQLIALDRAGAEGEAILTERAGPSGGRTLQLTRRP